MAPCYSLDNVSDDTNKDQQEQQQYSYAMELVLSPVLPFVMKAVVELQVLDTIAEAGPGAQLSPSQIVSRLPTRVAGGTATLAGNPDSPEMLDRMLRLLASYSILTCSTVDFHSEDDDSPAPALADRRLYGLAPLAKYFVPDQNGVSLAPMLCLVQEKAFVDSWYQLKGAVLEGGIPFHKVHGMPAFEYSRKDPSFNGVFHMSMTDHSTMANKKILESPYKGFEQVQKLVDVGGGVEHVGGDMFESVPKGDAIFMKWILHNWSDDHCLKLLKNCHKALPNNGKIIVVEGILPVMPDRSAATRGLFQMDLQMMAQLFGGKERTQEEFLALATGAGFSGIRLECFVCDLWIMEFYK
ncbi:hypothetical protein Vadar_009586 [Vaccinium darrowii]|uniref:Uncharacterized protein n=1 Tax=Vaccinium darrowii TaxID=229202 RepID=A0ACB7Y5M0_9ERIC|nr:hypothetical protein Vadar_009586 [Vaccinium darrowii]